AIRFKDDPATAAAKAESAKKTADAKELAAEIGERGLQYDAKSDNAANERRPLTNQNVQLVSRTFQDESVPSNNHEPMPTPKDGNNNNKKSNSYNSKNADYNSSNGNCSSCNGGSCDSCDIGCCEPQRMLF